MTEEAHNKFLKIDNMVNSMFSENVDLYEKIMSLPDFTRLEVGSVNIEKESDCAYISSVACMVETVFRISEKSGSFEVSMHDEDKVKWDGRVVSGKFTFDALEDFTVMIDDFRTYGIRVE